MKKSTKNSLQLALVFAAIPAAGLIYVLLNEEPAKPPHGPKEAYETHCGNCHGLQGEGLKSLYPPLAGSDYLAAHQEELPCMIRKGMSGPIEVNGRSFDLAMPGNEKLDPEEITDIISYVNTSWGNALPVPSQEQVNQWLKPCPGPKEGPKPQPRKR